MAQSSLALATALMRFLPSDYEAEAIATTRPNLAAIEASVSPATTGPLIIAARIDSVALIRQLTVRLTKCILKGKRSTKQYITSGT